MILAVALAGAVGCVAQEEQTASAEQHTGSGFQCSNKASISGVQCVIATLGVNVLNVDVKNIYPQFNVLDGNKLTILSNDLNGLNIDVGDINILNGNSILSDLVDFTKNDFLNKFDITVAQNNLCGTVAALSLTVCK
jgi:hypothetical protein